MDLTPYQGQRIEVEVEGRRCCGRVIRGPARQLVFLEERGTVAERNDMHQKLTMCRIWKAPELKGAKMLQVLSPGQGGATKTAKTRKRPWNEVVALAEADPAIPPSDWEDGLLAWSEAVHNARRKVDRSRKAMLKALHETAG